MNAALAVRPMWRSLFVPSARMTHYRSFLIRFPDVFHKADEAPLLGGVIKK
jgi:hypothetical protein